jgi:hypothetical protein
MGSQRGDAWTGTDLGIASRHSVRLLEADGQGRMTGS